MVFLNSRALGIDMEAVIAQAADGGSVAPTGRAVGG